MPIPKRLGDRVYLCPLIVTYDQGADAPKLEVEADVIDNDLQITRLTLVAGTRQLQRGDLRDVSLENIRSALIEEFGMAVNARSGDASLVLHVDGSQSPSRESNRESARAAVLEHVAEVYKAAEKAPVQAVADAFSKSHRWASGQVAKAEERGLLQRRSGPGVRSGDA